MSGLIARLVAAGAPGDLIEDVAMELARAEVAAEAIERRRIADRERQASRRHVMSRDTADVTNDAPLPKTPQTPQTPTPPKSNILPACETLVLPEGITAELWAQYRAMRQRIRKPLSPYAEQLALKRLRKFAEHGHPPGEIVEAAIAGSYQGLFAPKDGNNGRHHQNGHEWGATVAAADAVIAELERAEAAGHGPPAPSPGQPGASH